MNNEQFKNINMYNNQYVDNVKNNNIFKLNRGKKIELYTYKGDNNNFNGIIESANDDFVIMSEPVNGYWYMIPINQIAYIKFYETVNCNDSYYM